MQARNTIKLVSIAALGALTMASSTMLHADTTAQFVTCVGGASGMTLQLNPYKGIVRGCASKMIDEVLMDWAHTNNTANVKKAYTKARMRSSIASQWSEPTTGWASNEVKFTGDKSDCEIVYIQDVNDPAKVYYAMIIRADSVLGIRFVVNRQDIYAFDKADATASSVFVDAGKVDVANDPIFALVLADMNYDSGTKTIANVKPIEGGLSECYMDSGWRAIDEWNKSSFKINLAQPQLYAPNFQATQDNLLSVAVMGIIYNKHVSPSQPLNVTTQMERLITGGFVDNWDAFFALDGVHSPMTNYFREPLSGTCVTYKSLIMRGVKQSANGATLSYGPFTENEAQSGTFAADSAHTFAAYTDGVNYHKSGIPGLTCVAKPTQTFPDSKPGGGVVNDAVNWNMGGHGYTFLQKFTPLSNPRQLENIRVAKVNGYEPFDFSEGNSLPGINGVQDVDDNLNVTYYKNVVEGKYPLWTYNHCFALPGDNPVGATGSKVVSIGLADFLAKFRTPSGLTAVRAVGLIPLPDMNGELASRDPGVVGSPNENRGPGWARCGFHSPITGETVRDGMMMIQQDPDGPEGMPGEPYVEMRP